MYVLTVKNGEADDGTKGVSILIYETKEDLEQDFQDAPEVIAAASYKGNSLEMAVDKAITLLMDEAVATLHQQYSSDSVLLKHMLAGRQAFEEAQGRGKHFAAATQRYEEAHRHLENPFMDPQE